MQHSREANSIWLIIQLFQTWNTHYAYLSADIGHFYVNILTVKSQTWRHISRKFYTLSWCLHLVWHKQREREQLYEQKSVFCHLHPLKVKKWFEFTVGSQDERPSCSMIHFNICFKIECCPVLNSVACFYDQQDLKLGLIFVFRSPALY